MPNRYEQDERMDMYHLRMTYRHARMARSYGERNLSLGMRLSVEFLEAALEAEKAGTAMPAPSEFLAKRRG